MKTRKREVLLGALFVGVLALMSCRESYTTGPHDSSALAIVSFGAAPAEIIAGKSSTLSWTVQNAEQVEIDHGVGIVPLVGEAPVTPSETTTYKLTATKGNLTMSLTTDVVIE